MYFEGVNGQYKRQKTKLVGPYKCTQLFKFILILTKKKKKQKQKQKKRRKQDTSGQNWDR